MPLIVGRRLSRKLAEKRHNPVFSKTQRGRV